MFRAILDTCALVPGRQRDFLLQLAAGETYTPLWGTGILVELDYVLEGLDARRGRIEGSDERRKHLLTQMREAFPGATIDAPKERSYNYDITDPDDGHVVHAAIIGKADVIITNDGRAGFKTSNDLAEASIEILTPAEFAANTVAAHPGASVHAVQQMSARMRTPSRTTREIVDDLRTRYGMSEVSEFLMPLLD